MEFDPTQRLVIREGGDGDAAEIAGLLNHIGAPAGGAGDAMTPELVIRDILSGEMALRVLLAELDGRAAGVAVHMPAYECAFAARGRYLQDLAVHPWARRRGVGRALVARLAALTRDEGGAFLWWMNMETMAEARPLYRRIADVEDVVSAFAATREAFETLADEGVKGA